MGSLVASAIQMKAFMAVYDCMARLKALVQSGAGNPAPEAAKTVREFMATAEEKDRARLKTVLEDARIVGLNTEVALPFLPERDRWLAALQEACSAA